MPQCTLSSDFITGFCGESDFEHSETLSLLKKIPYDMAYMFAYSKREKTHAARHYEDNVPELVKKERLKEIVDTFYNNTELRAKNYWIGRTETVLIDGSSKKDKNIWSGRIDGNKLVILSIDNIPQSSNIKAGDYVKVKI